MTDTAPLATPVKFADADYYKLRALMSDAERCHALFVLARQQQTTACAVRDAFVTQMAEKYGFNPAFTQTQHDDAACAFSFS